MEREFVFIGNDFVVDFVNTRICVRGARVELLNGLEDVAVWLERAGKASALTEGIGGLSDGEKRGLFSRIMDLRNRLEEAFASVAAGRGIPDGFLDELNERLAEASGHDRIVVRGSGLAVERRYSAANLHALFHEEAARFIASMEPGRLKACENRSCILYFYDTSRNRQRRWCSMEACGNRVKVNRHYHRKKASQ
ncbi:MAG TPA: CGNR zinc finger domain-containing protein [Paenibacillaceae bacterium]